jgi:hypothetical protein
MTKAAEDNALIADVLMDRARVKTVPLDIRAFEFINASLKRDKILDDAEVGSVLFQKTIPLSEGMQLSLSLYNGSYKSESRPHLELNIYKNMSYKPDEEIEIPLDWQTITDEIPDDIIFKGSTLGIEEDYHIRLKVENS